MVSTDASLLQAGQPQLSQTFLTEEIFHPSNHLHSSPLDSLQQVHVIPMLRTSEWDSVFQVGSRENEGEELPPQTCWPPLLLVQPRRRLTFWTAKAHCQLRSTLSCTRTHKSFSAGLFSILQPVLNLICIRSIRCPLLNEKLA